MANETEYALSTTERQLMSSIMRVLGTWLSTVQEPYFRANNKQSADKKRQINICACVEYGAMRRLKQAAESISYIPADGKITTHCLRST